MLIDFLVVTVINPAVTKHEEHRLCTEEDTVQEVDLTVFINFLFCIIAHGRDSNSFYQDLKVVGYHGLIVTDVIIGREPRVGVDLYNNTDFLVLPTEEAYFLVPLVLTVRPVSDGTIFL